MIFYFSGTGNSQWVAHTLADATGEKCLFVPDILNIDARYQLADGERLGFVFPVYSWGMPEFFEHFIEKLQVENVSYVYFVCTCGDDTGLTKEAFCELVAKKHWKVNLGYAVQMPNTYICLPGFDVDAKDVEEYKLTNAVGKVKEIVTHICKYDSKIFDTRPGVFSWLKSKVIRPGFNRWLITSKYFWTQDSCVGCGKCQIECPMGNITIVNPDSKPKWGDKCVGCLKCYHTCPTHAIQFGRFSIGKGQYHYKK